MQLSREALLKACRDMVTIRRFEERVQEEFSKGGIPGFVHLYAGQEADAPSASVRISAPRTTSPARIAATDTASPRAATSAA